MMLQKEKELAEWEVLIRRVNMLGIIGKNVEPEFQELMNSFPEELMELEGLQEIDPFTLAKEYYKNDVLADQSIDPNANITGKSPVNFYSEVSKPILKLRCYYLLWKYINKRWGLQEANNIITNIVSGGLYFHDASKIDVPYCFSPDTSFLMHEGRPYGWLPSVAPKKLQSFMGQLREVTMDYSQENAGAIGLANALVNMAYYTRDDKSITDKEIEDELQQTVHIFHNSFRVGGDAPFTNLSLFCRGSLYDTFKNSIYPDGSKVIDNIDEIMRIQEIYAKFFVKGSPKTNKPYRFPITTVNIKTNYNGKIIDRSFFNFMADLNREKCVFNWHIGEKIATCCRLTSDLSELKNQIRTDTFGNGGLSIGSHRVVAINLHRVALVSKKTGQNLFQVLENFMEQAKKLLVVHKEDILKRRVDEGILKFFRIGWVNLNMFFSTFGFTGLYDSYEVLSIDKEFTNYASDVLTFMENFAKEAGQQNKGFAFNVEEIPAENASPKLAKKDAFVFGTERKLLSNQMVPLYTDHFDFFDRLQVSSKLMNIVSGGAILHLNINDDLTPGANRELLRRIVEDYGIPHFALNKGFSTCVNDHTEVGVYEFCPECNDEISYYTTRVVGFFTDTTDWAKARREYEFPLRKWYGNEEITEEERSGVVCRQSK